jgi:hypothetical protein
MRLLLLTMLCLTAIDEVVVDGPKASAPKGRGTAAAQGEYMPPTEPRTESSYDALYRQLRDSDAAAGKFADSLYPQAPFPESPEAREASVKAEEARNDKWSVAYEKELRRRLAQIAARERKPVEELEDIRMEGDARAWFVEPAKRSRLKKTEEQIQQDLKARREFKKVLRDRDKETKTKPRQKNGSGKK